MSYLLEALRKSEQERQQQVPSLNTATHEWDDEEPSVSTRSPWLMIIAVLLTFICAMLAALVWNADERIVRPQNIASTEVIPSAVLPKNDTSLAVKSSDATSAAPSASGARLIAVREKPSLSVRQGQAAIANADNATPITQSTARNQAEIISPTQKAVVKAPVKRIYDMDDVLRSQLPPMNMNSHIYSTDAKASFVMINNAIINVGQELAPGVRLETITPDGAVLSFQGEKFLFPAMTSFEP